MCSPQLRGAQVLAAARLFKQGFPQHVPLAEFRRQFRLLAPLSGDPERPVSPSGGNLADGERKAVEEMLGAMETVNSGSYRVGLSKVSAWPWVKWGNGAGFYGEMWNISIVFMLWQIYEFTIF